MSIKKGQDKAGFAPRAVTLFLVGTLIVLVLAISGFMFAYTRTSVADQSRTIAERDKLFVHTLARSIDIFVDGSARSMDHLAMTVGREGFTTEVMSPHIEDLLTIRHEFFVIAIADLEGRVIAGLAPDAIDEASKHLVGVTIADREYFNEVLATRKSVVSDAIVSKVLSRPTIGIASPVFNEKKDLIGVAVAGLRLDAFYDLAEYALGSEFAVPVVVDRAGTVLVHPDPGLVASGRNLSGYEPAKRALRGEEGFLPAFMDTDGTERSVAYAPISGLGWGVWVAQDATQFAVLRKKVMGATLPWAGSALLGMLGLFSALTYLVYAPMRRLANDTRAIVERGDLGVKVSSRGPMRIHEVETFAESFNGLLAAVKKMRDDLEQANAAKSRFLTVATHAFRTPISVASWTLDMMMGDIGTYDVEQRDQIMQLVDADKRIQLGFANLFAALELQGGTARADLQKGDLGEALRRAVDRLGGLAASRSVAITFEPDGVANAVFDEKKISLVFDVVLSNAVFYNRKDGKVRVSVRREGDEAVITVEDTGIGIPEAELRQLFQPFFRGEKASKKFTDGTGLGLHIARANIELHGGSIDVASTDAEGTRVTMRLPLRPSIT